VRSVITEVQRDEAAIQRRTYLLGWCIQLTNLLVAQMSLAQTVVHSQCGWCLERDVHLVKDCPIGIRSLYVQRDDQMLGLTRLLTLALRMLTLRERQVRRRLVQAGAVVSRRYAGQPRRTIDRPMGVCLLKAFA